MIWSKDLRSCREFWRENFLYHCCLYIVFIMHFKAFIEPLHTTGSITRWFEVVVKLHQRIRIYIRTNNFRLFQINIEKQRPVS